MVSVRRVSLVNSRPHQAPASAQTVLSTPSPTLGLLYASAMLGFMETPVIVSNAIQANTKIHQAVRFALVVQPTQIHCLLVTMSQIARVTQDILPVRMGWSAQFVQAVSTKISLEQETAFPVTQTPILTPVVTSPLTVSATLAMPGSMVQYVWYVKLANMKT